MSPSVNRGSGPTAALRLLGCVWTPEQAQRSAMAMGRGWLSDGVHKWLAYDRADRELIGRGGLFYAEMAGARRLEIGCAVREQFWGQGYASEIGRAGLAFAFNGWKPAGP